MASRTHGTAGKSPPEPSGPATGTSVSGGGAGAWASATGTKPANGELTGAPAASRRDSVATERIDRRTSRRERRRGSPSPSQERERRSCTGRRGIWSVGASGNSVDPAGDRLRQCRRAGSRPTLHADRAPLRQDGRRASLASGRRATARRRPRRRAAPPAGDVRDPVASLSLRQLAGQRIVVGYRGTRIPASLLARARARRDRRRDRLRREHPLACGARRADAPPAASPRAARRAAADDDRPGGRPREAPARRAVGIARVDGPPRAARSCAARAARPRRTCAAAGINVNLAPVVDLGRAGSYQRRTQRAFAVRPTAVSALGSAFVAGLQQGGVAATLKHFPGLGGVTRDEDALVQTVGLSRATAPRRRRGALPGRHGRGCAARDDEHGALPVAEHAARAAVARDQHRRAAPAPRLHGRQHHRRPRRRGAATLRRSRAARARRQRCRERPAAVRAIRRSTGGARSTPPSTASVRGTSRAQAWRRRSGGSWPCAAALP